MAGPDPGHGRRPDADREGAGHGRRRAGQGGGRADAEGRSSLSRTSSTQLREMQKLGPIQDPAEDAPRHAGRPNAMKELAEAVDEGELRRAEAMILSMTPEERRQPAIISGSRRLRIANGSGVTTADVNQLLKDFEGARKMMRSMMGGKRRAGHDEGAQREAPEVASDEESGEDGDEDPVAADGLEQAALLPRRGGRPAVPTRWTVHRDHREVPPAVGPLADRDRRGARAALAARRRAALRTRSAT